VSTRGRPAPLPLPGHPDRIFTVSELTRAIRQTLEGTFEGLMLQGEVTGYKGSHASGHVYFSLKDASSQIDVVLFRDYVTRDLLDILGNGMAVRVEGALTVYEKQGRYQVRAVRVTPVGYGALQARFDALRRKLEAEGLFAPERKRPLPRFPTRIGIVTSDTGAALQDMLRILRTRAPYARLVFGYTRVQGEGAAREIAAALDRMNARNEVEVIVVGRGGGSMQDLWAFNEELVVRAIVRSRLPVIAAVGHESDQTLADFAADERAATPTHAAQLVVKDLDEIRAILENMRTHARRRILAELKHAASRLRGIETHHALREPRRRVREGFQELDRLHDSLAGALRESVRTRSDRTRTVAARLERHSPRHTFARARERVETCRKDLLRALTSEWKRRRAHERLASFQAQSRRALDAALVRRRERLEHQDRLLHSFGHESVLERGYALVWSEGRGTLRRRGAELRAGMAVEIEFFDARAGARVTEIAPKEKEVP